MTEIRFYHLQRTTLEVCLPQMLEKTLERGQRAVVMLGSEQRVEALTTHLWTYNERSFLPHGSRKDGHAEAQPIWLTFEDENPNRAEVLFLADGATSARVGEFARVAELFDGNDPEAVGGARQRWTAYKQAGHDLVYFQQAETGRWEEKARG